MCFCIAVDAEDAIVYRVSLVKPFCAWHCVEYLTFYFTIMILRADANRNTVHARILYMIFAV